MSQLQSGAEAPELDLYGVDVTSVQPEDHRAYIAWLAHRKIRGFCGTIDAKGVYFSNVYQGNASLAESITADYNGRFLLELIQNANDVHPGDRQDGEIEVVFDRREGQHGTLYIANRGSAFSRENVNALCDMGLSSKPPGESIGNKGLGFRSVNHITDTPFIYSQAELAGVPDRFEGYCFAFAGDDELAELVSNPVHRELARRDLPLFHVPVWLDHQPEAVREFARLGFVTVISLPVRDETGTRAVEGEIEALRSQTVPILLFLTRLKRLSVRVISNDGEENGSFSLNRHEIPVAASDLSLAVVDLDSAGRFLLARQSVSEIVMKAAIADGIERKQLHGHWGQWKGNGEVALAVRLDKVVTHSRLYTFLPMGEQAICPFSGYLHGSFFPTSNRKGLDASIELNALLLDEATTLAATTVTWMVQANPGGHGESLDSASVAHAVADLLSWRKVDSLDTRDDLAEAVAARVAMRLGVSAFEEAPVVPCLGMQGGAPVIVWCTPARARPWHFTEEMFSADVAAARAASTSIAPVWPGLKERIESLSAFLSKHSNKRYLLTPKMEERAELVVRVASELAHVRSLPVLRWAAFYRDLVTFMEKKGAALAGQRILLCADGNVHRALSQVAETRDGVKRTRRRREADAAVFAPPARQSTTDEDLLKAPSILAENFAFLSSRLDWYEALAPARQFLESEKLVAAFDREAVLSHLSRVVRQDERKRVREDGLRWAFQIWRQPRESGRPFKIQPQQHRFFVPTIDETLIDASEAVFSASWPESTSGPLLQNFLDSAPIDIADLRDLGARRLASRSHRAFKGKGSERMWADFLVELGVQQGLQPVAKRPARFVSAYRMRNFSFCDDLGIPVEAAAAWKAYIEVQSRGATNLPSSTEYVVKGDILWLPGQGNLHRLTYECQTYYAKLIIGWLERTPLPNLTIEVHHHHYVNSDTRHWPSPVAAFLRSARWIPAEEPWVDGPKQVLCRAEDIWLAPDTAGERFLPFLVRPAIPIMRMLEGATREQLTAICDQTGLRVLHRPTNIAWQVDYLAQQYAKDGFDPYFEPHYLNLYYRTWVLFAEVFAGRSGVQRGFAASRALMPPRALVAPRTLVARRGGNFETVQMFAPEAQTDEVVYVRDGDDETVASLLEAGGGILFDARASQPARVGALLRELYGPKVRMISEADCVMTADDHKIGTGDVATVLQYCPRLRALTAIAMEALKGTDLQRLPSDRSSIIGRLERLLFQRVTTISFRIDGVEIVPESRGDRAFALRLEGGERIVAVHTSEPFSWSIVDESLGAICEAISQPALEPHLRLLVRELNRRGESVDEPPVSDIELEWLSRELRLSDMAKQSARQTLGARLERHLPWLRALVHMAGGMDAVDVLAQEEAAVVKDIGHLRKTLSPWLEMLNLTADAVLEVCRYALNVTEFREGLGLDFAALNKSLVAVHATPDTYFQLHPNLLASYVQEHELDIIDSLRTAYAEPLMRKELTPAYAEAREAVRLLAPDKAWLLLYKEVPSVIIGAYVTGWLKAKGAPALGANPLNLGPVADVRRANGNAVTKFVAAASPLIRAWCGKDDRMVPELWRSADGGMANLRSLLDKAGIFDFTELDTASLLEWTAIVGAWPDLMPLSLERVKLDLDDADFDFEKRKAAAEAEERRRDARSITFNGHRVDPEGADWPALAVELASRLPATMLGTPLSGRADFLPAKERRPKDGQNGESRLPRPGVSGGSRPPSQATDMIGRLGELAVYYWLRKRLPSQDIDASWRSTNAFSFTGRKGFDGHGYDFEVSYRNQIWQIEVKASLGDPCAFEFGETEVRAGRAAARGRSGVQYVIAYVSNLAQPERAKVEVLPNPMSEAGDAIFNLLGEGLRFGFRRSGGN